MFITQLMDWPPTLSRKARFANRLLSRLGFSAQLVDLMGTGYMSNVEQRVNLFHLCSQVLSYEVPGEIVELGSYTGSTAILLSKIIQKMDPSREIHLYDAWIREEFLRSLVHNFQLCDKPMRHKVAGARVSELMPKTLNIVSVVAKSRRLSISEKLHLLNFCFLQFMGALVTSKVP